MTERAKSGRDQIRLIASVSGQVQGVGFRWWTRRQAERLGLVGSATNLSDGRVEVVAEGFRADCERLVELLQSSDTPGQVRQVTAEYTESRGGLTRFTER